MHPEGVIRADVQSRAGNSVAGPLQNVRSRYRVRLNADKDIDPKFRFHVQLSTGPLSTQTTNDQDFGGMADDERWKPLETDPKVGVWTDDYSNLLSVFLWK